MISISAQRIHEHSYRLRLIFFGKYHICLGATKSGKWYWFLYFSRNGTPWASTIYFGNDWRESLAAKIRRKKMGVLFNPHIDENADEAIKISKTMRFI